MNGIPPSPPLLQVSTLTIIEYTLCSRGNELAADSAESIRCINLVLNRGMQFGLRMPGAHIEELLMSLLLTAQWEYMHTVDPDSREGRLLQVLKEPRNCVYEKAFYKTVQIIIHLPSKGTANHFALHDL
jgi:hypothetical protein